MKKLLIALVVLVGLALAAVLVGPSLVDWNSYKPQIADAARAATGRALAIDGDISLSILPSPTLTVSGLRFANAEGGSAPDMATLESLDVRVALMPLLRGKVAVESVTLVRPSVLLEPLAGGGVNWQFAPGEAAAAAGDGAGPPAIQLDRLLVEDATIVYRTAAGEERIEALTAEVSAGSLQGPFKAAGSARIRGVPATFSAQAGRLEKDQPTAIDLLFSLPSAEAELGFAGNATLDPVVKLTGRLTGKGANLARLIATASGGPAASGPLSQAFSLESDFEATPAGAATRALTLSLGDLNATGDIDIVAGPPLTASVRLALGRVDLDKLIPPAGVAEGAAPAGEAAPFALPQGILADLDVVAPAMTYKGGVIESLHVRARLAEGVLVLEEASALLPGGSRLALSGALEPVDGLPRFDGGVEAKSDNLRALLDWLEAVPAGVSPERLRKASLAAKIVGGPAQVEVSDLTLVLDASTLTGGVTVALPGHGGRTRPGFGVGLALDQLNLAGYVPAPGEGKKDAADGGGGLAALAAIDANVDLRVGSLTYNEETVKGLRLAGTIQDGNLELREFSLKDFAGGGGKASGTIADLAGQPRFDLAVDVSVKDTGRMLQFAGIAPPPAKLGAFKLGGKLAGGAESVGYDVAFSIAGIGAEGSAKGTAKLGQGLPRVDSEFSLKAKQAGPLLAIAGFPDAAKAKLGALALSGKAQSGADDLAYDVTMTLAGVEGRAALAGTIAGLAGTPKVDTRLDIEVKRPAALLAALGAVGPVGKLGALSAVGTLAGGADKMRLDLQLGALGGEAAVKGEVAAATAEAPPSFDLDLKASHPELRQLLAAFMPEAPAGKLGAFRLAALVKGNTEAAAVDNLDLSLGKNRITGKAQASLAGRPRFTAALKADTLDLASLMPPPAKAAPAKEGERWSNEPLDLAVLDMADAELDFTAGSLLLPDRRFDDVRLTLRLADGTLTIGEFAANAFGGSIDLSGELSGRNVPSLKGRLAAVNLKVEELMKGGVVAKQVGGPVSLQAEVAGAGVSMAQLVRSLDGQGNLAGTVKVATRGEQVAGSLLLGLGAQQLQKLTGGVDVASPIAVVNEAFTLFVGSVNALSGDFVITNGVLHTDNTEIVNDRARALTQGDVDIAAWTMNTVTDVAREGAPYLSVALTGPLDGPSVKLSGEAFAAGAAAGGGLLGGILQQVVPGAAPEAETGVLPLVLPGVLPVQPAAPGVAPEEPAEPGLGGLLQQVLPGQPPPEPVEEPAAVAEPEALPEPVSEEAAPGAAGVDPGAQGVEPGAEEAPGLEQLIPQLFQQ